MTRQPNAFRNQTVMHETSWKHGWPHRREIATTGIATTGITWISTHRGPLQHHLIEVTRPQIALTHAIQYVVVLFFISHCDKWAVSIRHPANCQRFHPPSVSVSNSFRGYLFLFLSYSPPLSLFLSSCWSIQLSLTSSLYLFFLFVVTCWWLFISCN